MTNVVNGNEEKFGEYYGDIEVYKKDVPVGVAFAKEDGTCETKEGKVSYAAGDAIMTGIEGEQWPIPRNKFEDTYEPLDGTEKGSNGEYSKIKSLVLAKPMVNPFEVTVSWSDDKLKGEPTSSENGSLLVQYGPGDFGVVSRDIFKKTYAPIDDSVQQERFKHACFTEDEKNELIAKVRHLKNNRLGFLDKGSYTCAEGESTKELQAKLSSLVLSAREQGIVDDIDQSTEASSMNLE